MNRPVRIGWFARWWIRRGLRTEELACGCQVGVYERFNGTPISVIDTPNKDCRDSTHRYNVVIDDLTSVAERHSSS